jgi:hypothetical protein
MKYMHIFLVIIDQQMRIMDFGCGEDNSLLIYGSKHFLPSNWLPTPIGKNHYYLMGHTEPDKTAAGFGSGPFFANS